MLNAAWVTIGAALCAGADLPEPMQARAATGTGASINASFAPNRLGANSALTLTARFTGFSGETPPPVRSITLHLPAGLGLNLHGSSSCTPVRLRQHGPNGCPQASLIGRGHAQLEVHAGSQTIPEQAVLWVFRGLPRGGSPTLIILGVGSTPLHEQTIDLGVLHADKAPYGAELALSLPAIPTLVYEPDASFDSLSVTIGRTSAHSPATVRMPRRCGMGGLPFATEVTFTDHSVARATTVVPCP